jgi:hypothetical protein
MPGSNPPPVCYLCGSLAAFECDGYVHLPGGKPSHGMCGRHLCGAHATRSPDEPAYYCPDHAESPAAPSPEYPVSDK